MTHAGEEFTLEAVGLLDFPIAQFEFAVCAGEVAHVSLLQAAQFILYALAFSDIPDDGGDANPFFRLRGAEADLHGKPAAIASKGPELQAKPHGARCWMCVVRVPVTHMRRAKLQWDQHFDWLAQQFLAGIAEHHLSYAVEKDNAAGFI